MTSTVASHDVLIKQLIEQAKEHKETNTLLRDLTREIGGLSKAASIATSSDEKQGKRLGELEGDVRELKVSVRILKNGIGFLLGAIAISIIGLIVFQLTGVAV